jgi:hypothetical protein
MFDKHLLDFNVMAYSEWPALAQYRRKVIIWTEVNTFDF